MAFNPLDTPVLPGGTTADTTPTLSLSGLTPNSFINLTLNNQLVSGTAEEFVDSSGNWKFTFSNTFVNGTYPFVVKVVDADTGDILQTVNYPITIDTSLGNNLTLTISQIAGDDVISTPEAGAATIAISGAVTGATVGSTVTLTVSATTFTGTVGGSGAYSIGVTTTALLNDSDKVVDASVTSTSPTNVTSSATATRAYTVNITPVATLSVGNVTADNILSTAEAAGSVSITGSITGDFIAGDVVTLTVNAKTFTGAVNASGNYTIAVPGSDLLADADKTIAASAAVHNAAGGVATVTTTITYTVNITPVATLSVGNVTTDNILSTAEAAGSVSITGSITGDFIAGDVVTLTVNAKTFTGAVNASGNYTIAVPGSDLLADADKTIAASAAVHNAAGGAATVTATITYTVNITPVATLSVGNVTTDNILSTAEAAGSVSITGSITGDFIAGDVVTLTVNAKTFTGAVNASGNYTIAVPGSDLLADADKTIAASAAVHNAAGGVATVTATKTYVADSGSEGTLEIQERSSCGELRWVAAGPVVWTATGVTRCQANRIQNQEVSSCGALRWKDTSEVCGYCPSFELASGGFAFVDGDSKDPAASVAVALEGRNSYLYPSPRPGATTPVAAVSGGAVVGYAQNRSDCAYKACCQ